MTSQWIGFFVGAGIPKDISAGYAVNFVENRIGMDMLMDLNKVSPSLKFDRCKNSLFLVQEYLKDLGVTVLGDIISILKHAKEVQGKMTSDRALKTSVANGASTSQPTQASTGRVSRDPCAIKLTQFSKISPFSRFAPRSRLRRKPLRGHNRRLSRETVPLPRPERTVPR